MARRDSGAGSVYQRSRDGRWVGYVTLPDDPRTGKRRRKLVTAKTKQGAIRKLSELRAELDRAGDLPTDQTSVAQWLNYWLDKIAADQLKPRTLATYRGYVDRYIVPRIGKVALRKVTGRVHVRKVLDGMKADGLSSTTQRQAYQVMKVAFRDAVREERIPRNPVEVVPSPQRAVSDRSALSAEDAKNLLLSVSDDKYQAVRWSVALLAGLRQGEALGLTRGTVDLERGVITVAWQLQRLPWSHGCGERGKDGTWPCGRVRGGSCPERSWFIPSHQEAKQLNGGLWLTRPKSRAGWREVPMAPQLTAILRRHIETHPPGLDGLIFTRDDGRPIDPAQDTRAWDAALRAAGLPDVPLHSARHSTASILHALGVPERTIVQIMGHSSALVTAGYTHVSTREMEEAMAKLGGLIGA